MAIADEQAEDAKKKEIKLKSFIEEATKRDQTLQEMLTDINF